MTPRRMTLAAVLALATAAGPALGQFKLGDGTKLDRNPLRGSGRRNPSGPDFAAEVRFRNAIVTGNAPGGLSFRGDVGYQASGEFSSRLGSNDLFAFRRDSVFSGLAGMGIRGTDALQYQFALTTGSTPPRGLVGTGVVDRAGAQVTIESIRARHQGTAVDGPVGTIAPGQPGADTRGTDLWVLRSPSAFVSTRALQPALVATMQDQSGRVLGLTASPLRGLIASPMGTPRPAKPAPVTQPPPELIGRADFGADGAPKPGARPAEADAAPARSGYDDLMARLASREADDRTATPAAGERVPQWRRGLDDLRRDFDRTDERAERDRLANPQRPERDGGTGPGAATQTGDKPESRRETLNALRDAGREPITRLAPAGFDAYSLHMSRGEKFLAEGQYFFAEERFTAALNARPSDPMAAIGRVHAQLGASLYASAAINLRRVFTANPELIGAKYGGNLLPDRERARAIIERLEVMSVEGKGVGRETGFLVAYLGFQLGDSAAVDRGLALLSAPAGDAPADAGLERLAEVIREVWTAPAEPGKP